jgi:hypothetical protein
VELFHLLPESEGAEIPGGGGIAESIAGAEGDAGLDLGFARQVELPFAVTADIFEQARGPVAS